MKSSSLFAKAMGLLCFASLAAAAVNAQAKPAASGNLYQEIMSHRAAIMWRPAKPAVPDDVCTLFQTCTGGEEKFFTLPPATVGGRQTGRALYWTHTGNKDVFILEHQTHSDAYFFLLSPDGNFQKAAYLEQGKPFVVVANELAAPTFNTDKPTWLAWAEKVGEKPAAASDEKQ